jgi:hypothetical protein
MVPERGDGTIAGALSRCRSLSCVAGLVAALAAPIRTALAGEVPGVSAEQEQAGPVGGSEQGVAPTREEEPAPRVPTTKREESKNPFRQSILTLDQSITTQTADVGLAPQSYVPLYELWLSFRPRYYFDEHWSVRARFDYTKELTNNQATTYYREDVFGDIWTDVVYGTKIDRLWRDTQVSAGLRALWPTSKVSQGNGAYVSLGAVTGAVHKFEIKGEDAPYLNLVRVGLTLAYSHPFTAATTPTSYGGFAYTRQNVDGFSFVSDQLTGQTLPEHVFWTILDTSLQITPRLSLTGDFITISEWHYPPSGNVHVPISGGSLSVPPPGADNQFVQNIWLIANIDYTLFDELDIGLGYYNLANGLAPDGQQRSLWGADNIWWSPDARLFFDLTANLDVLFDDARGRHKFSFSQASESRTQRIVGSLH